MLRSSEVMIVKVNSSHVNLENTHHCFIQELCKSTENKTDMLCQKNIHTGKDYRRGPRLLVTERR